MHLPFEEAAIPVRTERLHDADVNVSVVVAKKSFVVEVDERRKRVEIVVEKLLAEVRWKIGLGIEEKRSDIVLQRAFAATLIIHKIREAVAQHNVARLKVAVEEIVARSFEQKIGEAV